MGFDLNNTWDSIKDGISETAEVAHVKTNEFHEKYVSKITPDFGKYGDAAKFAAEMVPGVSEYNAIKDGDWQAFAIAAGIDIAAVAIGAFTAGAGYAAVKGGTSVAKAGVKVAVKEVAEAGAKKVVKETVEAGAKKVVKETVEAGAEKIVKETVEAGAEKIVKETVEVGAEKVVKETVEAGAEKVAKETVEAGAEKFVKETAEVGAEKVTKEVAESGTEKAVKELSDEGIEHIAYHTDEIERINQTPKNGFDGVRGDSRCYPDIDTDAGKKAVDKMAEYGQDSVKYEKGVVDFSPFSESTVKIDMTDNRTINFKNADEACSKKWNDVLRDGRNDWTASDIKEWRRENNFTWHERSDMKRCDLVSLDIHNSEVFSHTGGIAEFNAKNRLLEIGGLFDE